MYPLGPKLEETVHNTENEILKIYFFLVFSVIKSDFQSVKINNEVYVDVLRDLLHHKNKYCRLE